jgi:hypothetical protein
VVSATLLTLFVLPALYARFSSEKRNARKEDDLSTSKGCDDKKGGV